MSLAQDTLIAQFNEIDSDQSILMSNQFPSLA